VSNEIVMPTTSERIVTALRWGGYASFMPCVIESCWDRLVPPLAGFPISVCFTGLSRGEDCGETYVVSTYWFDPRSYHEDDELRAMTYRSEPASNYKVVIGYIKKDRRWEGRKLRDGEVIITASGSDLIHFIVQLTLPGVHVGEPVTPLLTQRETASSGVWIFKPDNPRQGEMQ